MVVVPKLAIPEIFKFVPVALVKFKSAIVPTVVKLGKEVVAEICTKVLVAKAG